MIKTLFTLAKVAGILLSLLAGAACVQQIRHSGDFPLPHKPAGALRIATPLSDPVVLRQKFDGEWPTDHYPVVVDIGLN